MPQNIIIGNIISFSASFFLLWGSASEKVRRLYLFGVFECILLFISQLFFGQGAAAVSLLIAAFRNYLLFIGKYRRSFFILIFVSTAFFGLALNTGGAVGLLPLFATLVYTYTSYSARGYVWVKLSLIFNLFLWSVYSVMISDIGGAFVNIFSLALCLASLVKFYIRERQKREGKEEDRSL